MRVWEFFLTLAFAVAGSFISVSLLLAPDNSLQYRFAGFAAGVTVVAFSFFYLRYKMRISTLPYVLITFGTSVAASMPSLGSPILKLLASLFESSQAMYEAVLSLIPVFVAPFKYDVLFGVVGLSFASLGVVIMRKDSRNPLFQSGITELTEKIGELWGDKHQPGPNYRQDFIHLSQVIKVMHTTSAMWKEYDSQPYKQKLFDLTWQNFGGYYRLLSKDSESFGHENPSSVSDQLSYEIAKTYSSMQKYSLKLESRERLKQKRIKFLKRILLCNNK